MSPLPAWNALHPALVHFPVALLLTAPVFVLLALLLPKQRIAMVASGIVLMVLGTGAAFLAAASGEAAEEIAAIPAAAESVMERHEELAEVVRFIFAALSALLVAIGVALAWKPKIRHRWVAIGLGVFLVGWLGCAAALVELSHQGGRLVHEYGVRAAFVSQPAGPGDHHRDHDDDD
jgi:uncharacterized membrane protein